MARSRRDPDDIIRRIERMGDRDLRDVRSLEERRKVLDAYEAAELKRIEAHTARQKGRPHSRLDQLERDYRREAQEFDRLQRERQRKIDRATAWREVGIEARVTAPPVPRLVRAFVVVVLGMIDFYVFALAVAKGEDVPAELSEPAFLLGGVLGLIVFAAGLMLARLAKDALYVLAQRAIKDEIARGDLRVEGVDQSLLVVGYPQWVPIALFGTLFAMMAFAGFLIRWNAAGPNDDLIVIALQSLVPLVGVAVELYLHDPSHVVGVRPSLRSRRLTRQWDRWESEEASIDTEAEAAENEVTTRYDVARKMWGVEQAQRGFPPLPEDGDRANRNGNGHGSGVAGDPGGPGTAGGPGGPEDDTR